MKALVCEDAQQFNWLARGMMLSWVYEGRPYKKLPPVIVLLCKALNVFLKRFWEYCRQLPTPEERLRLEHCILTYACTARRIIRGKHSFQLDRLQLAGEGSLKPENRAAQARIPFAKRAETRREEQKRAIERRSG